MTLDLSDSKDASVTLVLRATHTGIEKFNNPHEPATMHHSFKVDSFDRKFDLRYYCRECQGVKVTVPSMLLSSVREHC